MLDILFVHDFIHVILNLMLILNQKTRIVKHFVSSNYLQYLCTLYISEITIHFLFFLICYC